MDAVSRCRQTGLTDTEIRNFTQCGLPLELAADVAEAAGDPAAIYERFGALIMDTPTPLISAMLPAEEYQPQEARWLVPGLIPEGQISLLCSDGGLGKTGLWVELAAAVSTGRPCLLDPYDAPPRQPGVVVAISYEDSVGVVLRPRLQRAQANLGRILLPKFDTEGRLLEQLRFGADGFREVVSMYRPRLMVIDPLQGAIPPKLRMAERNAMRSCLAPLVTLGEEYGTSFLIVCHTNKRQNAFGRDRISDSADLWDIARSVLMVGKTPQQGIRYLSNEKNNYAPLAETILFTVDQQGRPRYRGRTDKRDADYQAERHRERAAPARDEAREFILRTLREHGGSIPTAELSELAKAQGIAEATLRNAKKQLSSEKAIGSHQYYSKETNSKYWMIHCVQ